MGYCGNCRYFETLPCYDEGCVCCTGFCDVMGKLVDVEEEAERTIGCEDFEKSDHEMLETPKERSDRIERDRKMRKLAEKFTKLQWNIKNL